MARTATALQRDEYRAAAIASREELRARLADLAYKDVRAPIDGVMGDLTIKPGGAEIEYVFDGHDEHTGIPALLRRLDELGIECRDLQTRQSSLEEIFVSLVTERA